MKPPAATRLGFALMASLMVGPALTTAQQVTPLSKRTVAVTATYTGRGAVDDAHEVLVFLFTTPTIDASSIPIKVLSIKRSGATATFLNVEPNPVYVVVVYNETGAYHGMDGPPPPGTPIFNYAPTQTGPLTPVPPGPATAIKITFNDSRRFGR